jgi:hypothetical protein
VAGAFGSCPHPEGTPNPDNGSTSVQLFPFSETPNPGHEYKAWLILASDAQVAADGIHLIFDNNSAKTDNFKCRQHEECPDGEKCGETPNSAIGGVKYCDKNGNGEFDAGEEGLGNWTINISGLLPDGITPFSTSTLTDSEGNWSLVFDEGTTFTVCEELQTGYYQTGPKDDATTGGGATASAGCWSGTIGVDDDFGLDFFNVVLSSICAHKFYDANVNGKDDDNQPIEGWQINLSGTDILGASVSKSLLTGKYGDACFEDLLPGTYTVSEAASITGNWLATTATSRGDIELAACESSSPSVCFGNVCLGAGGGLTLGFWSNKNGQKITTTADLSFLSSLWLRCANGTDFNPTTTAQLSTWLLGANAVNMANMLSAQLAAMELNVRHAFVSGGALVYAGTCGTTGVGTQFISINSLMTAASTELCAHANTTAAGAVRTYQECLKNALDRANNNLNFVQGTPCSFSFAK